MRGNLPKKDNGLSWHSLDTKFSKTSGKENSKLSDKLLSGSTGYHRDNSELKEFEIYLDDDLFRQMKSPIRSVKMTFPRKLFGKDIFTFEVDKNKFSKLFV